MNEEYVRSLQKLGLNPKNYEIFVEKPLSVWVSEFLQWAFNPPPRPRCGRANNHVFYRMVWFQSRRMFR
jgi:hypothetical protein